MHVVPECYSGIQKIRVAGENLHTLISHRIALWMTDQARSTQKVTPLHHFYFLLRLPSHVSLIMTVIVYDSLRQFVVRSHAVLQI